MTRSRCAILCFLMLSALAVAHEGHQPLPTRGLLVDLPNGRITLSASARSLIDVQTTEVEQRSSTDQFRAYARLVAPWTGNAVVTSRLAGRVASLHVRPGDVVEQGQLLAELDSLDLHTLRLSIQEADNTIATSQRLLDGLEAGRASGAVTAQRILEAELQLQQARNDWQVFRSRARLLNVPAAQMESWTSEAVDGPSSGDRTDEKPLRLEIRSLIPGVVAHSDLAVGKYVEPTEHLMEVIDLSSVWVQISILERDWHRVAVGQSVRISLTGLPGRTFDAQIDTLGRTPDSLTHTNTAWAVLQNTGPQILFRPGMTGQAELFHTADAEILSVPVESVRSDGAERYVLVEESSTKKDSQYRKVSVVVGRTSGGLAEISPGRLLPGDRVVTRGGHQLASVFFPGVLKIGPETERSIGLKLEQVAAQTVERILSLDGAIDLPPDRRTEVSPQLGGKLQRIHVDRGQMVSAGDVLCDVASLELQDLQLELLKAHLDLAVWRETLLRRQNSGDSLSKRTLIETEARVSSLEIQVRGMRRKLNVIGIDDAAIDDMLRNGQVIESLSVRAPMDGLVVDFDRVLGQVVRADESLFQIHDPTQAWVQVYVSERDSAQVRPGQSARVRLVAYPELLLTGTVVRIGPTVAADSRIQSAWISLPDAPPGLFQHSMTARVTLTSDTTSVPIAVSRAAIVRDGLRNYVFVRDSDGIFDRRFVKTGQSDDRNVEILSGLTAGESVAVGGVAQLQTAFAAVR